MFNMATTIAPANPEKTWDEILGISRDTPDEIRKVANSALYLATAHLRPESRLSARYTHTSQLKRFYGKILWNYLGDQAPSLKEEDTPTELGHLYFAYFLRKILEAKPIVSRT